MKKILFLRNQKAYLPEIDAYIRYFNRTNNFLAFDSLEIEDQFNISNFDILWEIKGIGGVKPSNQLLIHEYASLSTGFAPYVKNHLKSIINYKPNLRIFLNNEVKKGFNFKDNISYCFRDMGIDEIFIKTSDYKKEYDFVYVGSISKQRQIDKMLYDYTLSNNNKLCLIGNVEDSIYKDYKDHNNITFTGKVNYDQVPEIASKAIYGINYIPDKYPYNLQTSTKLLEYLAMGLRIVTTNYKWVQLFEQKHNCSFYKLNNEDKFNIKFIEGFEYKSYFNAKNFMWDKIIEDSKIVNQITQILN